MNAEKPTWQILLEALQTCEKPHGYSVSQLLQVLSKDFSVSVTEKTLREVIERLKSTNLLQITVRRTGPFSKPVNYFSLKKNISSNV